jgi:hypothetical protein
MPRCPLCASARITILVSLHPHAFCSSCGTRWIQDGHEQRAIKTGPKPLRVSRRPEGEGPACWPRAVAPAQPAGFYRTAPRHPPGSQ